jgi:hypothetical protein
MCNAGYNILFDEGGGEVIDGDINIDKKIVM